MLFRLSPQPVPYVTQLWIESAHVFLERTVMATTADMPAVTETMQSAPMDTVHLKLQTKQKLTPQPPNEAKPKGKLRLDPLRALEPARKKLTTLESQRIMAVLVDSIKRSEVVTILPYIVSHLDRFSVSLGTDLVKMLQDHRVIIQSFEDIKAEAGRLLERQKKREAMEDEYEDEDQASSASSTHSSVFRASSQLEMAMKQLQIVAKQMQSSCKNILRAFTANPSAMNVVLKDHRERAPNAEAFIVYMNELKDIIMGKLLTTPVEEAERNQYLTEISEREKYNAGVIEKLEAELKLALEDKEVEVGWGAHQKSSVLHSNFENDSYQEIFTIKILVYDHVLL